MRHTHRSALFAAILSLLIFSGCVKEYAPECRTDVDSDVKLVLKVKVGGTMGIPEGPTRAASGYYPETPDNKYPYEFDPAASQYENVRTLRIIIVRPDNTVEHNRMMTFEPHASVSGAEYGDFEFPVHLDQGETNGSIYKEKKRIYIIANEETTGFDFASYDFGSTLTPRTMAEVKLNSGFDSYTVDTGEVDENGEKVEKTIETALPFIDNDGDSKQYLPITEFFDIDVTADVSLPTKNVQEETLFITRSLVKFEFYVDEDIEKNTNQNFRISEIKFHSLGDKAYLFPFETKYSADKYAFLNDKDNQRIITEFTSPGDAEKREYTFMAPAEFGHNGTLANKPYINSYLPMKYFFGTAGSDFSLDVKVEYFNGVENDFHIFKDMKLPNLPIFPRNTIVKVHFRFTDTALQLQVDLVPYIGIVLKPGFGFIELLPGDHERPSGW